jgi:hypothetical protein
VTQSTDQMVTVVPYSSEVQQPIRATAVLGCHPHTHYAAPFDREHGRAASLHPDGWPRWPALGYAAAAVRTDAQVIGLTALAYRP